MAQLLLISEMTRREGVNNIGDIVGVFDDDHIFSPAEIGGFDIKKVDGKVEDVYAELDKLKPDTSKLTEEEKKLNVVIHKYTSKLVDDKKMTIAEMCVCNITVKV